MLRYLISLTIVALSIAVLGQTKLLPVEKDPMTQFEARKWGANRAHYGQFLFDVEFDIPHSDASRDYHFGASWGMVFGYTYRYRIANPVNIGVGLNYRFHWMRLNRSGMLKVYDNAIHDKVRLSSNDIRLNPFIRINLSSRRGNYLGNYIDLGAFGAVNVWRSIDVFDEVDDVKRQIRLRPYKMINNTFYGVFATVGFNTTRLTVSWNLSNNVDDALNMAKLNIAYGAYF